MSTDSPRIQARIKSPGESFIFADIVLSHGWLRLQPFRWEADLQRLWRIDRLASGRVVRWALDSPTPAALGKEVHLRADEPLSTDEVVELEAAARWMLSLEMDLSGFHGVCRETPGLRRAAERRQGRILRSATLFEDLVKTVCSINTTWGQTVAMVERLVKQYGVAHASGNGHSFPTAAAIAAADTADLQLRCRVGYRAEVLSGIARAVAEGRLDLDALTNAEISTADLRAQLLTVRGLGPYAVGHILMLLGRHEHLPLDSWVRRTVREAWYGGDPVSDREILRAFERFHPFQSLVYRCYDWQGANREEVCRDTDV